MIKPIEERNKTHKPVFYIKLESEDNLPNDDSTIDSSFN